MSAPPTLAVRVLPGLLDALTPTPPPWPAVNVAVWIVLVGALVGWQVVTTRSGSRPSFGAVVRILRRRVVGRWALLFVWAWLGWHTFVRGALG